MCTSGWIKWDGEGCDFVSTFNDLIIKCCTLHFVLQILLYSAIPAHNAINRIDDPLGEQEFVLIYFSLFLTSFIFCSSFIAHFPVIFSRLECTLLRHLFLHCLSSLRSGSMISMQWIDIKFARNNFKKFYNRINLHDTFHFFLPFHCELVGDIMAVGISYCFFCAHLWLVHVLCSSLGFAMSIEFLQTLAKRLLFFVLNWSIIVQMNDGHWLCEIKGHEMARILIDDSRNYSSKFNVGNSVKIACKLPRTHSSST